VAIEAPVSHMFFLYALPCQMDSYAVNMMPGTSVATHISFLHDSMVAHMHVNPFLKFHSVTVCTRMVVVVLASSCPLCWV